MRTQVRKPNYENLGAAVFFASADTLLPQLEAQFEPLHSNHLLMLNQQLNHRVDFLNAMPTASSQPNAIPYSMMNAISAPPSLAKQFVFVWKQSSQMVLVSKNRQDPVRAPDRRTDNPF